MLLLAADEYDDYDDASFSFFVSIVARQTIQFCSPSCGQSRRARLITMLRVSFIRWSLSLFACHTLLAFTLAVPFEVDDAFRPKGPADCQSISSYFPNLLGVSVLGPR